MDQQLITVDDIIRAGACVGGVYERLREVSNEHILTAAMPPRAVKALLPNDEHRYIDRAAKLDGYGDGYGHGDGYGDGDGHGDGYGDGDGHGYGYGHGDGYGDGDGHGDGYGDGYGDGDGES